MDAFVSREKDLIAVDREVQGQSLTQAELAALREWVGSLPEASSGPHRFGGVEFRVEEFEFMHFHGQTHLDIRLSKEDQARVLASGQAERHLYAPQAGWVTFRIKSVEDIEKAKEIILLAYNHASSVMREHQARREEAK